MSKVSRVRPSLARTFIIALLVTFAVPFGLPSSVAGVAIVGEPGSAGVASGRPKAVLIVGPTHELTDFNLAAAEKIARQAEDAGMDVRRVFFPYATWENVLANIQGASLVVYMGHGYGWPNPYTATMKEGRQDGMGLNTYAGSGPADRTYYGATRIVESIHLAPHAVVLLNHLCYSAGNGEVSDLIPTQEIAHERADNMASGWLAAGAGAVFATAWGQSLNFPRALMTTNTTMDAMFMTPSRSPGSLAGFIGWNDVRLASDRTPGAVVHLDPHPVHGFLRALTGNLEQSTAEWRSGSSLTDPPPPAG